MDNKVLVHKHLIIRAEAKNPPMDVAVLRKWFQKFINEIGMKVMMGPYIKYSNMIGNRGITGAAIIETSHIVMHVWDEPDLGSTAGRVIMFNPIAPVLEGMRLAMINGHSLARGLVDGDGFVLWTPAYLVYCSWPW